MPSRASSTAKKMPAKKATAKKAAARRPAKEPTPESRSGPVTVSKLRDRLHPGLLASALDLADGDIRRIEAVSYSHVSVSM